jgi:hypothetical protein
MANGLPVRTDPANFGTRCRLESNRYRPEDFPNVMIGF